MKYINKILIAITLLLAVNRGKAQIVDCNAFMKGNYIEIGISPIGSFGSSVGEPIGYHGIGGISYVTSCFTDTGSTSGVGFVADPDRDGWSVGTPPYFGDYFLPGTPYEGWSIQVAGTRIDAFSTSTTYETRSGPTASMFGAVVSDTLIGATYTSVWQGMYDSLQITQTIILDTGNLYFTVKVTLTNLSSSPIDSIFYMRSVDPDNAVAQGGSFATNNFVRAQYPDTDFALVMATDPFYTRAYLGMGSTDSNAQVLIFDSWPPPSGDLSAVYSRTSTFLLDTYYTTGDSAMNQDIAIGIIYNVPHLAPADSAAFNIYDRTTSNGLHPANSRTLTYFYSFSPEASANAVNALRHTTAIKNINNTKISIYPNPAKNVLNVSGLLQDNQLQLVDMMGNTINTNWTITPNSINTFRLDIVASGHYILVVMDASGSVINRMPFVKE